MPTYYTYNPRTQHGGISRVSETWQTTLTGSSIIPGELAHCSEIEPDNHQLYNLKVCKRRATLKICMCTDSISVLGCSLTYLQVPATSQTRRAGGEKLCRVLCRFTNHSRLVNSTTDIKFKNIIHPSIAAHCMLKLIPHRPRGPQGCPGREESE